MEAIGKDWNSRCLEVVGCFRVYLLKTAMDIHPSYIKNQVELADKSRPWVTEVGGECSPRVVNCNKSGGWIDFELRPQFNIYPRQMYAFHRYLCDIARHLAITHMEDFGQVNVWMQVQTECISFRTPAGDETYRQVQSAVDKAISDLSGKK